MHREEDEGLEGLEDGDQEAMDHHRLQEEVQVGLVRRQVEATAEAMAAVVFLVLILEASSAVFLLADHLHIWEELMVIITVLVYPLIVRSGGSR
jgi:hypothetical protein